MTVLRRLDSLLEPTKADVLAMRDALDAAGIVNQEPALRQASGQAFYNISPFTLRDLRARASQVQLRADSEAYLDGLSSNVQDILENIEFRNQIRRLSKADALGTLIEKLRLRNLTIIIAFFSVIHIAAIAQSHPIELQDLNVGWTRAQLLDTLRLDAGLEVEETEFQGDSIVRIDSINLFGVVGDGIIFINGRDRVHGIMWMQGGYVAPSPPDETLEEGYERARARQERTLRIRDTLAAELIDAYGSPARVPPSKEDSVAELYIGRTMPVVWLWESDGVKRFLEQGAGGASYYIVPSVGGITLPWTKKSPDKKGGAGKRKGR